ncbi:hypothetical protein VTG60DRAFT_3336 [Thermothelomyces hinnuleus]
MDYSNSIAVDNQDVDKQPQTNFWKDVRDWVTSNNIIAPREPAPVVVCPICHDQLVISRLPYPDFIGDGDLPNRCGARLFVCGHLVCDNCYQRIVEPCRHDPQEVLRCPVCRYEPYFPAEDCQHMLRAFYIPCDEDDRGYFWHIPLTITEGGQHPERCNACSGERCMAVVEAAAERLGVAPPRWFDLLSGRGGQLVQGLTPEESSALENLRLMWGGRQDGWSEEWSVPGLGLAGDV